MSFLPDSSSMELTPSQLSTIPEDVPVSKAQLEDILADFLVAIDFRMPSTSFDFTLEEPIMAHFQAKYEWDIEHQERAINMAKWISTGVGMCYPFASRHSRISFGIHSTYLLFIDDIGNTIPAALEKFASNFASGKPQAHPVLQSLAGWLAEGDKYMGPFANAMNIKNAIEFVHGCLLESKYDGNMQIPQGAVKFPAYFRANTGFTEPYAFFCFPQDLYPEDQYLKIYLPIMQDLCDYINFCNDVMSFYKESVVDDERFNYVYNYASAHGIPVVRALDEICADVIQNVDNIRTVLAGHKDVLRDTERFIQAYAAWYLIQDRYRLDELMIDI